MGLMHRSKASASKMTKSKKKLESGISADFLEQSSRLERLSKDLGKLAGHVSAVDTHWAAVVKSQRQFADDIASSSADSPELRTALEAAEETSHNVYRDITSVKASDHPTKTEAARLIEYKKEVDEVLKEKPKVVKAYSEANRYDVKTDKLVGKAAKASEKKAKEAENKAARNSEKKDAARTEYKSLCDDVTARMKETYAKRNDVLATAHESFWHIQSGASGVVHTHSRETASNVVAAPASTGTAASTASPRISTVAQPASPRVAAPVPA